MSQNMKKSSRADDQNGEKYIGWRGELLSYFFPDRQGFFYSFWKGFQHRLLITVYYYTLLQLKYVLK